MLEVIRWARPRRVRPEVARMRAAKGEVGLSSLARRVLLHRQVGQREFDLSSRSKYALTHSLAVTGSRA